ETAFFVSPTGLTTGRIPYKERAFSVDFDFTSHNLIIRISDGVKKIIKLKPVSVAQFYQEFLEVLKSFGISVTIYPIPVEFLEPIPFEKDRQHHSYNKDFVERWWQIQLRLSFIFDRFRTPFTGKSSPIHFFWGSFDLAGSRFSGKKVSPPHLKGVM